MPKKANQEGDDIVTTDDSASKPDALFDNGMNRSERVRTKSMAIRNLSPSYHYHLINVNSEQEKQHFANLGYEPARGNETFAPTSFDELLGAKPEEESKPGALKIRGSRLLVRIPLKEYEARTRKMITARHRPAKSTSQSKAQEMMAGITGAGIEGMGETEQL
jgi:hypothetical protein